MISTQIAFGALIAGREPTAEDIEPLSWAIYQAAKGIDALDVLGAPMQLQGVARALVEWTAQYDVLLTPALAERAAAARDDRHLRRGRPDGRLRALGRVHAVHAGRRTSPASRRSRCRCSTTTSGLPLGVQLVGQPGGRGRAAGARRAARGGAPWAERRAPVEGVPA